MSIWNKILVGLIAVASLGFFYLAARTLKTHTYWYGKAAAAEARDRATQGRQQAAHGRRREGRQAGGAGHPPAPRGLVQAAGGPPPGVVQLPGQGHSLGPRRGDGRDHGDHRQGLSPTASPKRTCSTLSTTPTVRQKGRYLGEFVVTSVADKQVTLAPAVKLNPREIDNLAAAKGTWTLYEVMPQDSHDIFAEPERRGEESAPAGRQRGGVSQGRPARRQGRPRRSASPTASTSGRCGTTTSCSAPTRRRRFS